jgi:hypothetical protein
MGKPEMQNAQEQAKIVPIVDPESGKETARAKLNGGLLFSNERTEADAATCL